jgi:acyl-CoA dehydrogenase
VTGAAAPAAPRVGAIEEVMAAAERHADRTDRQAEFPVEALDAMRRTRLLGLLVPIEHGGAGGGLADVADVTMALARADLSVAMIFAMHCQQVAAVARFGGDRLRADLLPKVARGDVYLASVTTERGTGGHLLTSESKVASAGRTLRIDRDAPVVTGGPHADGFLVTVLAPDAASPSQVSLMYAARDQLELTVLGEWTPLGMRATHSVPMRLVGTVPEWQVVGRPGGFRSIVTAVFGPVAHVCWSAAWLGAAAGACSRVIGHVRGPGRKRFDTSSELLLTRLARIRARLDVVHALLRHTLTVLEASGDPSAAPVQLLVNALKTEASEESFAAVHELIELVGLQHGYDTRSALALERTFRDLRSASLNYGNDRLRLASGALALLDPGIRLA